MPGKVLVPGKVLGPGKRRTRPQLQALWLKGPTHDSTAQARKNLAARKELTDVEGKTFWKLFFPQTPFSKTF